jgi:hypothetical protein
VRSQRILVIACWFFITIGACPVLSTPLANTLPAVSEPEYRVYNAMLGLMQFQKKDLHMLIAGTTLNFKCGGDSGNPVLMNGCSGMRMPPEKLSDVMRLLQENWPSMETASWEDFAKENADSATLRDNFSTAWKHKVAPLDIPLSGEWASPDVTIFLSRVGFNVNQTEAVVYCLTFSYMDNVFTEGDYFIFRTDRGEWQPKGRVTYVKMDSSSNDRTDAK